MREKCGVERGQGQHGQRVHVEVEVLGTPHILVGQRYIAHEAIVRVDGDHRSHHHVPRHRVFGKRKVLSVPINAVTTRDKSDTLAVGKAANKEKKEADKKTQESETEEPAITNVDDLEEVVFVLQKDQTVKRVKVKSAIQDLNNIEIVDGLKEGEEVVVGPYSTVSKLLRNGMKVKVVKKEELFEVKK